MSEEVKKEKEEELKETVVVSENADKKEEKEADSFSFDSASDELPDEIKAKLEKNKIARSKKKLIKKKKKKGIRSVKSGSAHIQASYNNTIVTIFIYVNNKTSRNVEYNNKC